MRHVLIVLALVALMIVIPGNRAGNLGAASPALHATHAASKRIAISFDDVPRSAGAFFSEDERAAKLIAALKAAKVEQVALFVNPGRINYGDGDADRIARYVAAGAVIANHSFTHYKLSRVSAETYLGDIDKASAWLAGRPGYRPWFRFPTLDEGMSDTEKRDAVRAGLKARGLRNAYVTVDGLDWKMEADTIAAARAHQPMDMAALRDLYIETMVQASDFADDLARRAIGRSPPHMLLLHETDLAALFIGDLVDALRKDGWEIVTPDAAYSDAIYAEQPDVRVAAGTLIEQLAWVKGVTGARWYDRDDIHVADALFAERVLHATGASESRKAR